MVFKESDMDGMKKGKVWRQERKESERTEAGSAVVSSSFSPTERNIRMM